MKTHLSEGEAFRHRIDDSVLVLFSVVAEAVGWSTDALLAQDSDRARVVIDDDQAFDVRCEELTSLIKERLAASGVGPTELEDLIAVLQIISELERSADLAEHIAQRAARGVGGLITPRSRGLIERLGSVVSTMWRDAATAYRHRSRDAGFDLRRADDAIDQLAADLIDDAVQSNVSPQVAIDLGLLARFYERLGDHAVNLARRVEYMGTPRRLGGRAALPRREPRDSGSGQSRLYRILRGLARFRFTPADEEFFELFRAAAENCRDCAVTLRELVRSLPEQGELVEEVKVFERAGDALTVEILNRLDRSFVTPFDREDIHALAEELDDVVDSMLAAASVIDLAHDQQPPPELAELTDTLGAMADELVGLVGCLSRAEGARHHLDRIRHLERQGDAAFRNGLGKLLSGAYEPLAVITWKDIIEAVEASLNSIEDASDVIEGILVKNS